ncbi:aminodeoxychorismate lyase [Marinimicrobium agarilyticum]|uniref:aminodeoxychorismate lyase n=1 Tax=Marinimicrobium agarilyticum TaxID=306546 RepID=UPI000488CC26|nr:aminodeoxychorismate lyase [Marinimicrobium agarilyticum]
MITMTNGVFDARLSPLDRGLAYGDGLFETCRVRAGQVPLWALHWQRLSAGARRLGIPLDGERLERERERVLNAAQAQNGVLKLIVTRGEGGRAYQAPVNPEPSLCWQFRPGESPAWERGRTGVTLYQCQHRLGDNPALAGMKHLNRLEYVLARSEWGDDYPEGLLLDAADRVIEGTLSNVFVRLEAGWRTPALERNGVAGVMRQLLLESLAPAQGIAVSEATISLQDLMSAREWFVCNSVFGIWPVTGLAPEGGHWAVGEQSLQLQRAFESWLVSRPGVNGKGE